MTLDELINSIDIVEYISQYVDLKQRNDEWWGLSCFKDEKTPSFSVRQNPPCFYDYSSGIAGNVFTFVRYYNNCSKHEAVEILKRYAGVSEEIGEPKGKMAATLDCKRFARPKPAEKESKGVILPDDYMDKYSKRQDKLDVWRKEGISDSSLQRFQVRYDSFSDRLVYPIRKLNGDIVNVGGRTLNPNWKEENLRKYNYFFKWGTLDTIYGLFENREFIKQEGCVVLFEGVKSVLIADTWGVRNTGAILTSHLNPAQLKILVGLGCRVIFALDKDVNIKADRNIQKLKQYVNVEYIFDRQNLLGEKDSPVDKGWDVFKTLCRQRLRLR